MLNRVPDQCTWTVVYFVERAIGMYLDAKIILRDVISWESKRFLHSSLDLNKSTFRRLCIEVLLNFIEQC